MNTTHVPRRVPVQGTASTTRTTSCQARPSAWLLATWRGGEQLLASARLLLSVLRCRFIFTTGDMACRHYVTLRREGLAPRHGAAHLDPRAEAINGALPASLATAVAVKDSPAASVGSHRMLGSEPIAEALPAASTSTSTVPHGSAVARRTNGLATTRTEIELAPLMTRETPVASTSSSMDSASAAVAAAVPGAPGPAASAARLSAAKHRFVLARGAPSLDDDAASEGAPDIESDEQMAARLIRHARTRSLDGLPSPTAGRLASDGHRQGQHHQHSHHHLQAQELMPAEGLQRTVRHGGTAAQGSTTAAPAAGDASALAGSAAHAAEATATQLPSNH